MSSLDGIIIHTGIPLSKLGMTLKGKLGCLLPTLLGGDISHLVPNRRSQIRPLWFWGKIE